MNIEEIRKLMEQHQAEIDHLNETKNQLDASRNSMTEEQYNRELENINNHLATEQEKLQTNAELNRNYNSMLENLRRLDSLNSATARDNTDRMEMENERSARLNEVQRAANALPEDLRAAVRTEILSERQAVQNETVIEEKDKNQEQIEATMGKTKKEQLDEEITRHQEEISHLNNVMSQLAAARGILSEEEYNRERENITRYIERENNKLAEKIKISNAYDNMLSNIRKLNALDDIIPRDKQDEEQLQDEKEAREEEIKKARGVLPEEYQEEVRNIIQQESLHQHQDNQQQERRQQNDRTATEQMLDPNFKPHLIPWDEYKKLFRQAQRESIDNEENQIKLNNIHNKYKSDRKLFQKDENGNIICYENTQIPRPRDREIGEDPKAYEEFLTKKYGPAIENYYKNSRKEEQTPRIENKNKQPILGIEERKPVGLIEEKQK